MSKSIRAEEREPSPHSHQLQQFLAFLKQEKGFADATIVNRKRSLTPFLAWLVGQCIPLSAVSPSVITKYFTDAVASRWKRTSVSFHVQSLRSFFRYARSRGWCTADIAASIDAPRLYTYENLPQGPAWKEVRNLLASVVGTKPVQVRTRCEILSAPCMASALEKSAVCVLRTSTGWKKQSLFIAPNRGKFKLIH